MNFAGQEGSVATLTRAGRRPWPLRGACLGLLMLLAACGFQMRGTSPLPFDTFYVGIPDTTRFGADVRRAIQATSPNTKIVSDPKQADAQLQQIANTRSMREVSLNAQGRVEEYELGIRFSFRVIDAKGRPLLPDTTLEAFREMPYDDKVVQAKEGEAESLYRNMQQSLVSRLVRQLTSNDVRVAAEKNAQRKPGDEEGPVFNTNPPPTPKMPPTWNRPSIPSGPQIDTSDYP